MAVQWQEWVDEVKQFDINDINEGNIGAWPVLVRAALWVLAFVLVLVGGYFYVIADLRVELDNAVAKEAKLKTEFEKKAFKAAKLEPLKKQMAEMEESFGILLGQLPADTEVPGLLEDMTEKAVDNGLEIDSIKLQPERTQEFYIELPIAIEVEGTYHDLAAFVSGIASLPRIVTLHDYKIKTNKQLGTQSMSITAKTYRYKEIDGGS
ncbi:MULTISPECIES: type 4a pilus biogenesis protein PilO [Spongiibacter]|jgi:type IV pilus assembly protein PilO|uniref:type 4a pilus biogenesis protein PilO n=1 Tax=Spongiibacter TaxID=630749 RepID=UPI000C0AAAE4|nr:MULTISPECIES: type 4a pilus biogenesis protein PilO [Spongiibacter]MAK43786.1 pilus assembly protein PilP [Spongiibacter sp.]MBM7423562.1 type IV pilus assembly protein PilO [Spongiibacter marinus]